jgi:hypothetical protein
MASDLGKAFVQAIADRDESALFEVLSPTVDFRALTPSKFWEASSATDVVHDVILGKWFEESERVEAVESIETDTVVDTERVGYRLRVVNDDGAFAVEQQAYYRESDGRIAWLRIMCAGYRRLT